MLGKLKVLPLKMTDVFCLTNISMYALLLRFLGAQRVLCVLLDLTDARSRQQLAS